MEITGAGASATGRTAVSVLLEEEERREGGEGREFI